MEDNNRDEKPYIKEKVRKKGGAGFGKWIARIVILSCMALLFGAIAGVAFVIARPWAEKIGARPEPETTGYQVELPTYESQSTGAQVETTTADIPEEEVELTDNQKTWIRNQISVALGRYSLNVGDAEELNNLLSSIYITASKSLVTLTAYKDKDVKWSMIGATFFEVKDAKEYLVVVNTSDVLDITGTQAVFFAADSRSYKAELRGYDHIYNLSVFSVSAEDMPAEDYQRIHAINLGNNYNISECNTVMLIGAPYGVTGSVSLGNIMYIDREIAYLDGSYSLFYADAKVSDNASGFMINLSGELVGIMDSSRAKTELGGYACAIGTDEMTGTLNCMANGHVASFLGVFGQTVTDDMQNTHSIPQGVYVTSVMANSAAYNAGISPGDIITGISTSDIKSLGDLTKVLVDSHLPNERVIVRIKRDSAEGYKEMEVSVTLGSR